MPDQERDAICQAFGERVHVLRRRRKLSQEDLAQRAGLHRTYIGGVERGEINPTLVNVVRIGQALEVDATELLTDVLPPQAPDSA